MHTKDKPSVAEMLLDPTYDMEELIRRDLYTSFHNHVFHVFPPVFYKKCAKMRFFVFLRLRRPSSALLILHRRLYMAENVFFVLYS